MSEPRDYEMKVRFTMADPEGTAPIRVVAGHASRVAHAWGDLAGEMFALAAALDRLTTGPADEVTGDE